MKIKKEGLVNTVKSIEDKNEELLNAIKDKSDIKEKNDFMNYFLFLNYFMKI